MNYYFAYGSNMDLEQMRRRCPDSKLAGVAVLEDHQIGFTRFSVNRNSAVADVLVSPGRQVWGILYEVSTADLEKLDIAEGVPTAYRRSELTVSLFRRYKSSDLSNDDEESLFRLSNERMGMYSSLKAFVYEVLRKEGGLVPSLEYLSILQDAAFDNYFPRDYQDELNQFSRPAIEAYRKKALDYFCALQDLILEDKWPEEAHKFEEWGGANLVITGAEERRDQLQRDYPQDLVILTLHYRELSWLVDNIYHEESIRWQHDASNKHMILGEMGQAMAEIITNDGPKASLKELALAVVYRAYRIFMNF
jgi:hypothetical protein